MYCKECGQELLKESKFCVVCGTKCVEDDCKSIVAEETSGHNETVKPPFCTNCGSSVKKAKKICPVCKSKLSRNYSKFCRYCGEETIGKRCSACKYAVKNSVVEIIARIVCILLLALNVVFLHDAIFNGDLLYTVFSLLFLVPLFIFVFRKKQMDRIKCKLIGKKVLIWIIYFFMIISLFLNLFVPIFLSEGTADVIAIEFSQNYIQSSLKNPESLQIHDTKIIEKKSVGSTIYYEIMIDYSAQNGFGGYNRNSQTVRVKVDDSNGEAQLS